MFSSTAIWLNLDLANWKSVNPLFMSSGHADLGIFLMNFGNTGMKSEFSDFIVAVILSLYVGEGLWLLKAYNFS